MKDIRPAKRPDRRHQDNEHEDFYEAMPMTAGTWTDERIDAEEHDEQQALQRQAKRMAIFTLFAVGLLTAAMGYLLLQGIEAIRGTTTAQTLEI